MLGSRHHISHGNTAIRLCTSCSCYKPIAGHRRLRYVIGRVLGYNNIGIKKCTTPFLWVLNLGQVGEILENFQKHPLGESF